MKKAITAIVNPELHETLKKQKEIEIIGKDIQYQEGIFEIIENKKEIDIIIISEDIIGNLEIIELIKKIKMINKEIKIIILLDKEKTKLEQEILKLKNTKIIYLSEIQKSLKNARINMPKKEIKNKIKKENDGFYNNILTILGTGGVGKSVFIYNLISILSYKKILIIDLDILNNTIQELFKIKKDRNSLEKNIILKKEKIENYIINVNEKVDILSGISILLNSNFQLKKVKDVINKLAKKYDVVLIDTSLESLLDKNRKIIDTSNFAILLTEGSILEVKKTKKILELYSGEGKIKFKNILIVVNKYTNLAMDISILKRLFKGNKVIGKLNYYNDYQLIMEKNILSNLKIKKEYEKIANKINIIINQNIKEKIINKIY